MATMELGEMGVVPTEDAVEALMDHLVAPHLPTRFPNNEPPPISLQRTIAHQVHAVYLLYNYYHRRQHPHLEFLDFESFCRVAVNAKPIFLQLLKYMRSCEGDKSHPNLSITEAAIHHACSVSIGLHSFDAAWPVSKVAVFLTDSTERNCFLASTGTTPVLWSLIQKSVPSCKDESEMMVDSHMENGNNNYTNGSLRVVDADEAWWCQHAMSAVKEATDIDPIELSVLESHVTYSLTEEKTTSCFFIMKSNSVNNDVIQVPIKDIIDRLQGPLVKKSSEGCLVTNVVEYFHLLPYIGMIAGWFSRVCLSNASVLLSDENINKSLSPISDQLLTTVATEKADGSVGTFHTADFLDLGPMNTEHLDQKENGDCYVGHNLDDCKSFEIPHPDEERKNNSKVVAYEMTQLSTESDLTDKPQEATVNPVNDACKNQSINVKLADGNDIRSCVFSDEDGMHKRDDLLIPFVSDSKDLEKIQAILATEGSKSSKDALRGLFAKQKQLYQQQRQLEDEIAKCENDIHRILNGDELLLNTGTVTEVCNSAEPRDADENPRDADESNDEPHYCAEEQQPRLCTKRKRFSESIMDLQNPCQVLDEICSENHWALPRYSVFCTTDGFGSNATVHGMDFEFSVSGDLRGNPREARESAASHMLIKLHSM